MKLSHHINQAIRAHGIMKRDVDYVVKDGEVLIVDEFTGRIMIGRRYSDGLHQAIEAKEGVEVARENKTLASITFQNYFRLYGKLSGMTGTAKTEEEEFRGIYGLDVVEIPTNKPVARIDENDRVYKNVKAKYEAVVREIEEAHATGQPVLVGTVSIDKSEILSRMLKAKGIKHEVLNAKQHEKEAQIIAQAGKKGAVTIATNMAGRGTDISLGGNAEYLAKNEMLKLGYSDEIIAEATGFAETDNEEILEARAKYAELFKKHRDEISVEADEVRSVGGLYIIGTERHESRRIDNQLRGRSGRQGDPGRSMFFIGLDDDLMRLFFVERFVRMVSSLGLPDDEPIQQKILTSAIENAQKKVEGRNYSIRKYVLQYDDVMNKQREIIYGQRKKVIDGEDLKETINSMIDEIISAAADTYCNAPYPDDWDLAGLYDYVEKLFGTRGSIGYAREQFDDITKQTVIDDLHRLADERYAAQEQLFGANMREVERVILLRAVDSHWMDHIDDMDQLKNGINLRAYGQHNPVDEYKFVGFDMFEEMIAAIREDTVKYIMNVKPRVQQIQRVQVAKPTVASHGDDSGVQKRPSVRKAVKVGRNDPCPCGSGKKYKNCCMAKDEEASAK